MYYNAEDRRKDGALLEFLPRKKTSSGLSSMVKLFILCLFVGLGAQIVIATTQRTDANFNASVARPAYSKNSPRVLLDEAHNNTDTSTGTYAPFSDLISNDGYRVVPNVKKFSKASLTGCAVLVIVNADGPPGDRESSPFTDLECDVLRDWVYAGGSLLLICDQAPFSAAAAALAKRFGIDLTKGFTIDSIHHNKDSGDETELVFSKENGLLEDHPIIRGRNATEQINRVVTFTGTSVKGPAGSVSFLKLADTAKDIFPADRKPSESGEAAPDPRQVPAVGRAQGVALSIGKGRVVVLGEAAMLTAQVASRGFPFGMNVSGFDNRQLALNIMHWLSGLLR